MILSSENKKEIGIFCLVAGLLMLIPSLNAWGPESGFLSMSAFQVSLWGKYLTYAILAMSLNLLWGYTGLLCLCQSLFFALGGYAMGMYLMLMIGERGAYKSTLPDFMVFLGYQELPIHWQPFYSFWFTVGAVLWVPGLVAMIFGFLAFRSRIKGVYFSILTQALTYAVCLLFFRNDFTFGGNNGFTDFKDILGASINDASTTRWLYIASALLLLITYLITSGLLASKLGKVQQAIRDSENRVLFSGYSTTSFKLVIFVLSAMIAGAAGALYVPQVGGINPSAMEAAKSLEVVVWVAVGGRGTKWGPVIGAILVNLFKSYTTQAFPDYWLIIMGGMFVCVVLFMPNGIVGVYQQVKSKIAQQRSLQTTEA
ncbi:urea ABC transporter permease subunit UrtC [Coraliomargarita sp. SDUM461003]|uniref:Urea ABC transporter permease subunit UrtC n=1 Tax=Thalassobacterium maritimum TaxID=3041265 RepID=A0ABU1AR25_9BACT|nr:urea ABC transporter permease subunit UrtC [Coraliomargarita sp. SDUM461003]MDQ8206596.1 urea ABC transporter permease subunit UrtC [Coraliomargarita sp. SDUM461003]